MILQEGPLTRKAHLDALQVTRKAMLNKQDSPHVGRATITIPKKPPLPQRSKSAGTKGDTYLWGVSQMVTGQSGERKSFLFPGGDGCKNLEAFPHFLTQPPSLWVSWFRSMWKDLFDRSFLFHRVSFSPSLSSLRLCKWTKSPLVPHRVQREVWCGSDCPFRLCFQLVLSEIFRNHTVGILCLGHRVGSKLWKSYWNPESCWVETVLLRLPYGQCGK